MLIDRNFKIPFSFLDPLSTHLFRIHGSWKTSFSCQVFFPRLGRLSFKVCILLCLLMPSQQTNSLIASTDLSVTYNKGRGKQAFWSPNTITEKAFSICFDSILNLLFVLRAQCLTLKWLPPWDAGHNALLCKIPSFLSIKMELSVLSLMELLNFFFFSWTFMNTAEHMAAPEYLGSDAQSHIHLFISNWLYVEGTFMWSGCEVKDPSTHRWWKWVEGCIFTCHDNA